MEVFAVWEVPRGFGLDALKEMVFGERVRITEYWNFCLIALGFGALGRCHSSRKLRQEGNRKVLKPLSLGNPQSEQRWGFALPRLNSFIPILEYQLTGYSGPSFPFVQQRSLLYFGSPGPIPITGAASLRGGTGDSRAEIPFSHRRCPRHRRAAGLPAPRALRQLPGPRLAGTCLLGEVNDQKNPPVIPFPPPWAPSQAGFSCP